MKGFFVTELIIVIALISIFSTVSISGFVNMDYFFKSRSAKDEILAVLNRARNLSLSNYQESGWSFRVYNNQAMIFKGIDYENRDENFDEFFELPKKITATTSSFIYFSPITGFSNDATTTINQGTTTSEITISSSGIVR